jgi:hypothetical protein
VRKHLFHSQSKVLKSPIPVTVRRGARRVHDTNEVNRGKCARFSRFPPYWTLAYTGNDAICAYICDIARIAFERVPDGRI